jgi:hypothetical protein
MGTTPLAPTAVTSRAATNGPAPSASEERAVSTTKAVREPRITVARPRRSDRGPQTRVMAP